jgi:ferritin-like metal-binding protein YciE
VSRLPDQEARRRHLIAEIANFGTWSATRALAPDVRIHPIERNTMAMMNLRDLYVDQLRDLYSAEQQILVALPKMIAAANDRELRKKFEKHLSETQRQADRLMEIFDDLGVWASGHHCRGMEGLLLEGDEVLKRQGQIPPEVMDAALICSAQRVEHYEMAGYGCVRTFADMLGLDKHRELLQKTLNEEGLADHLLTNVAEDRVNQDARGG